MESKRGLSEVVSTVMIIALVLVIMGIVWVVVQNLVSNSQEDIEIGLSKVNLEIDPSATLIEGGTLFVKVNRGVGKGNLTGIQFIFFDGIDEQVIKEETEISELGGKRFPFTFDSLDEVKRISIAPVFKTSSGKEVIGRIQDTYEFQN